MKETVIFFQELFVAHTFERYQGISILIAACSGAAVYIVLPEKKLDAAKPFLAEAFEVP